MLDFLPSFDIEDAGNWIKFMFVVNNERENVVCEVGVWNAASVELPKIVKLSLGVPGLKEVIATFEIQKEQHRFNMAPEDVIDFLPGFDINEV